MNKIRASIEQSKKLIELGIDVSTADMYWDYDYDDIQLEYKYCPRVMEGQFDDICIPAWSLSALLKLIPNYQIQTQDNCIGILYGCKEEIKIIEGETPIDVVFEMVCWLLENKKI